MSTKRIILCTAVLLSFISANAETKQFDIDLKKPGAGIQETMYGIFFEDINFAAGGGLYAELVKNRSFEYPFALEGWKAYGKVEIFDDVPFECCPHYARLSDPGHAHKQTGLDNESFFGVGIEKGKTLQAEMKPFSFSIFACSFN